MWRLGLLGLYLLVFWGPVLQQGLSSRGDWWETMWASLVIQGALLVLALVGWKDRHPGPYP